MGEHCDFENEFYPRGWPQGYPPYRRKGKTKRNPTKTITITLSMELYAKYKAIGHSKGVRKLIADAPAAAIAPQVAQP